MSVLAVAQSLYKAPYMGHVVGNVESDNMKPGILNPCQPKGHKKQKS